MKLSQLRQLIREEVREAINNENTKLNLKKNGIYILDGGLNNNDEWDEKSLKKITRKILLQSSCSHQEATIPMLSPQCSHPHTPTSTKIYV